MNNKVLANFPFKGEAEKELVGFSTLGTNPTLLEESRKLGFYNGDSQYNKLFSDLFFSGGKLNFKEDLDPDFKKYATKYLKCFMGSFEAKHEEKESICALLLSELIEETK